MVDDALNGDACKVIDLTTAEDGWQNLVLLRCGKDEHHIAWGFFQCLQEGIEGLLREHVNLVDDEYLIFARLGRYAHLLNEFTNVVDRVVRSGVQFVNAERTSLVEGLARFALSAGVALGSQMLAVDGLRKDARTSGLSHASRTAEQVGMSQSTREDGVLQRSRQSSLPDDAVEGHGAVFTSRHDVLFFHCSISYLYISVQK